MDAEDEEAIEESRPCTPPRTTCPSRTFNPARRAVELLQRRPEYETVERAHRRGPRRLADAGPFLEEMALHGAAAEGSETQEHKRPPRGN